MPQKKDSSRTTQKKPGVKVQDLAPKKDAKGGFRPNTSSTLLSGSKTAASGSTSAG